MYLSFWAKSNLTTMNAFRKLKTSKLYIVESSITLFIYISVVSFYYHNYYPAVYKMNRCYQLIFSKLISALKITSNNSPYFWAKITISLKVKFFELPNTLATSHSGSQKFFTGIYGLINQKLGHCFSRVTQKSVPNIKDFEKFLLYF